MKKRISLGDVAFLAGAVALLCFIWFAYRLPIAFMIWWVVIGAATATGIAFIRPWRRARAFMLPIIVVLVFILAAFGLGMINLTVLAAVLFSTGFTVGLYVAELVRRWTSREPPR